jgi:hypothetical protein
MARTQATVIFRYETGGGVYALFPGLIADDHGHVTCYAHVGQHSAADYDHCIAKSRPATPAEYAALASELEAIGYDIVIKKRKP